LKGLLLWTCALVLASAALARPAAASEVAPLLIPRELASLDRYPSTLIKLAPGRPVLRRRLLSEARAELVSRKLRVWALDSGTAQELVPRLARQGLLEEFEPDFPRRSTGRLDAGDPLLLQQTWLSQVGAAAVEPPGVGVPVLIIDSGLDLSHPEFAARRDTTPLNIQTTTGAREFHGTAVSSIIGAPANGLGVVGVYPEADVRVWDASPDGYLNSREVIAGIEAAAALPPSVINLSLGGASKSRFEEEAVLHAFARGHLIVAASGNSRRSQPAYPASLPHVLTVGAVDALAQPSAFSAGSPGMDVVAPGEQIPVAVPSAFAESGFISVSGTSFAAAIVSGAAAWVWSARRQLDNGQVLELLRRSARTIAAEARDPVTGFGLLDLPEALRQSEPPKDPLEPNDDVVQVRAGGLFSEAKPAITSAATPQVGLVGRVDTVDDSRDLYRIWLPARSRISIDVRSRSGVDARLWRGDAPSIHLQGRLRRAHLLAHALRRVDGGKRIVYQHLGRADAEAYVEVFVPGDARPGSSEYALSIASSTLG